MDCNCPEGWPVKKPLIAFAPEASHFDAGSMHQVRGYTIGHTGECEMADETVEPTAPAVWVTILKGQRTA